MFQRGGWELSSPYRRTGRSFLEMIMDEAFQLGVVSNHTSTFLRFWLLGLISPTFTKKPGQKWVKVLPNYNKGPEQQFSAAFLMLSSIYEENRLPWESVSTNYWWWRAFRERPMITHLHLGLVLSSQHTVQFLRLLWWELYILINGELTWMGFPKCCPG